MFNKINNNIIKILGIDTLPVEQQKDMMEKLGAIVYQEVMLRALDLMTEEDKDAFEKVISENGDPEAMFSFLAEKIPNIEAIVTEESEKLREESANIMSQIGN